MWTVIADSGPLIHLASGNAFWLLQRVFASIWIPEEVHAEVMRKPDKFGAQDMLDALNEGWIRRAEPIEASLIAYYRSLEPRLSIADTATIAFANRRRESPPLILTDERTLTRFARREGIETTGSIGVLIRAKKSGFIERIAPFLNEMERHGQWMTRRIYETALEQADEPISAGANIVREH